MRLLMVSCAAILLTFAACDRAATPSDPSAPATLAAQTSGELTETDRAALLGALRLSANPQGQVLNECGEWVTPTLVTAELGGAAGKAHLVAIGGGPTQAACYGDGPDLHLMLRDGASFRQIYSARGRVLILLPTETNDVHDIADGGPGFSFPLWRWNGRVFAMTNREVSDAEITNATFLP